MRETFSTLGNVCILIVTIGVAFVLGGFFESEKHREPDVKYTMVVLNMGESSQTTSAVTLPGYSSKKICEAAASDVHKHNLTLDVYCIDVQ